jgi:hypothetical protein
MDKQKKKNNKTLFWVLICLGLILFSFLAISLIEESKKSIDYKGVKFTMIKEGTLTFYNTQIPIYSKNGEQVSTYNFYLRTNPKELAKVEFAGDVNLMKFVAINHSNDIDCSGYGIIALQNMATLYTLIKANVIFSQNATCEPDGMYMVLNIEKSNENKIEEIGPNCYNLKVNGCEVFPATERFMIDTFAKIKEKNVTVYI